MSRVFEQEFVGAVNEFVRTTPLNAVPANSALNTGLDGERLIDDCIFTFGDASDPMFEELKQQQAVGPLFRAPKEWLPDAVRVISFFAPFSETVKASNRAIDGFPSGAWLHGRIDGQKVVFETCRFIVDWLEQRGFKAIVPSLDPRFKAVDVRVRLGHVLAFSRHHHREGHFGACGNHRHHCSFHGDAAPVHGHLRLLQQMRRVCEALPRERDQHRGRQAADSLLGVSRADEALMRRAVFRLREMPGRRSVREPHPRARLGD